jgi:hypothetical protein
MKHASEPNSPDEHSPVRDRWIERVGEDHAEGRAGALFRAALRPEPLAAIRERLRRLPTGARHGRPRRAWRVAVALGLMVLGGAMTATASWYLHHARSGGVARMERTAPRPSAVAKPRSLLGHGIAPATLAPPGDVVSMREDPGVARSVGLSVRRRSPPPSDPIEPPRLTPPPLVPDPSKASTLAEESKVLTSALRRLRQDDDAPGALAILDEHDARFGAAALAPEAALARIEALIKLRRNGDALSLLDGMTPAPVGIGRELLIARAELRSTVGRCATATLDFDLLLRGARAFDSITERALWGRASCRAGRKDDLGARDDLHDYLSAFPSGRFAPAARGALGE